MKWVLLLTEALSPLQSKIIVLDYTVKQILYAYHNISLAFFMHLKRNKKNEKKHNK